LAQKDSNPYVYTDSNKRYMTYDWYLKRRFGGKIAKVSLDIGTTCPNLDGSRGHGGCIYCKSGSASAVGESMEDQYENGKTVAERKWKVKGFIPYFQSNTNTYGDLGRLSDCFFRTAQFDGAVMLDIATRADCLGEDVIGLLVRLAEKIPLTVELGLQTTCDRTAEIINRCHTFEEFCSGYGRLRDAAGQVNARFASDDPLLPMKRLTVGVHIINGLPGEGYAEMMRTAEDVAALHPDMVKIHLMHILSDTPLAAMYERGEYSCMSFDEYVSVTCDQLEMLPGDVILGRITGDGMPDDLVAPLWSRRKTEVANGIDKELYRRGTYQGFRRI